MSACPPRYPEGVFGYVWNGVKTRFSQLDDSVATPHRLAGQKFAPKDADNVP